MSEEKKLKARVVHKHKTEAEWCLDVYTDLTKTTLRDNPFIPLQGELIIYDDRYVDKDGSLHIVADRVRYKIGDGVTLVTELPFVDSHLVEKEIGKGLSTNDFTDELKTKLNSLKQIYSINTSILLSADGWVGDSSPYTQIVTVDGVTENSRIELCPTVEQFESISDSCTSLMAINEDSVITVYAFNNRPTMTFNMPVIVSDVVNIPEENLPNAEGVSF